MSIDFLDVDFTKDPKFVVGDVTPCQDGDWSFYGKDRYASFGDEEDVTVVPRDRWNDLIKKMADSGGGCSQYVSRIYNQKSEGSCVANATSQSNEILQARQFGKENVVHLSAMSLYKRIGSSPSSGAMVSDGLEEMAKRGILPLDDEANKARFGPHVMPNTGWSTKYPTGWEETAKHFRCLEWFVINSFEEMISALLYRRPVVVGRSGHSICYCDPVLKDGKLVVKYANSWGEWGEEGYGYDSESKIQSSSRWAFCPRSIVVPEFQMV